MLLEFDSPIDLQFHLQSFQGWEPIREHNYAQYKSSPMILT